MFCVLPKLGVDCWLKPGFENDPDEPNEPLPKPPDDGEPNAELPPNDVFVP
jgi:hypothetical protein